MADTLATSIRPDLLQALMDHAEHGITIAEREGNDTCILMLAVVSYHCNGIKEACQLP